MGVLIALYSVLKESRAGSPKALSVGPAALLGSLFCGWKSGFAGVVRPDLERPPDGLRRKGDSLTRSPHSPEIPGHFIGASAGGGGAFLP